MDRFRRQKEPEAAGSLRAAHPSKLASLDPLLGLAFFSVAAFGAYMGGGATLFSWTFSFFLVLIWGVVADRNIPVRLDLARLSLISYLFLSAAGLFFVVIYRGTYGRDLGWSFDDSYYFYQITLIADGSWPELYTLYEPVIALFARLLQVTFGQAELLDLLPLNWAIGSVCVGLASELAYRVAKTPCPPFLVLACLIGNVDFVDTNAHLYRDGMMLLFFLLTINYGVRRRYGMALAFGLLCGMVRGANGMLALFGLAIIFCSRVPMIQRHKGVFTAAVLLVPFLFILGSRFLPLEQYARSFIPGQAAKIGAEAEGIGDLVGARSEEVLFEIDAEGGDTTQMLHRVGPVGLLAKPFTQIFAPFRLGVPYWEYLVEQIGRRTIRVEGFSERYPIWWLTIILWPFIGPLLLLGMYKAYREGMFTRSFLILFMILVFVVAYISFQPRHSLSFRVLVPAFLAIACSRPRTAYEAFSLTSLRLAFFVGLVSMNLMVFLR